jgi:hypothetical protein
MKAALRERALPRRIKKRAQFRLPLRQVASHKFKIGEIVLLKQCA